MDPACGQPRSRQIGQRRRHRIQPQQRDQAGRREHELADPGRGVEDGTTGRSGAQDAEGTRAPTEPSSEGEEEATSRQGECTEQADQCGRKMTIHIRVVLVRTIDVQLSSFRFFLRCSRCLAYYWINGEILVVWGRPNDLCPRRVADLRFYCMEITSITHAVNMEGTMQYIWSPVCREQAG